MNFNDLDFDQKIAVILILGLTTISALMHLNDLYHWNVGRIRRNEEVLRPIIQQMNEEEGDEFMDDATIFFNNLRATSSAKSKINNIVTNQNKQLPRGSGIKEKMAYIRSFKKKK